MTAFAVAGLAAAVLSWLLHINTNLLYLTYLLGSYLIILLLMTRRSARLGLFAFLLLFLFYSPKPVPAVPEQRQVEPGQSVVYVLPAGATRSYRFKLAPLREREGECGSLRRADIYVQGKPVEGDEHVPVLSIDHGIISAQEQEPFVPPHVVVHARAEFTELPGEVRVGLHNQGPKPFGIFLGPELGHRQVYPEAVFMTFDTPGCRIIAHSLPID